MAEIGITEPAGVKPDDTAMRPGEKPSTWAKRIADNRKEPVDTERTE